MSFFQCDLCERDAVVVLHVSGDTAGQALCAVHYEAETGYSYGGDSE